MRQVPAALVVMAVVATSASTAWSCKKGSGTDTPTGPTSAPPPNEATVASRNGCTVTYTCPNVDINGNANPATPTFDRLTLSTGTSSSCRVDHYRNVRPNPGDNIPIELTIRNPDRDYFWSARGNCQLHTSDPLSGPADSAGPFQARVGFGGPGSSTGTCDGRQLSSGDNFTQPLILEIRRGNGQAVVAACGVTVWGYVTPGR